MKTLKQRLISILYLDELYKPNSSLTLKFKLAIRSHN